MCDQRFDVFLKELEVIQSRFDKYDTLLFRIRQIAALAVFAILAASYQLKSPWVLVGALAFIFISAVTEYSYISGNLKGLISRHTTILRAVNKKGQQRSTTIDLSTLEKIYDPFDEFEPGTEKFKFGLSWHLAPKHFRLYRASLLFYVTLTAVSVGLFLLEEFVSFNPNSSAYWAMGAG